jgi:hypothetical protein
MEMLEQLQPRSAGSIPLEARAEFRRSVVETDSRMMCAFTCGCRLGTDVCVTTGNSQFIANN